MYCVTVNDNWKMEESEWEKVLIAIHSYEILFLSIKFPAHRLCKDYILLPIIITHLLFVYKYICLWCAIYLYILSTFSFFILILALHQSYNKIKYIGETIVALQNGALNWIYYLPPPITPEGLILPGDWMEVGWGFVMGA